MTTSKTYTAIYDYDDDDNAWNVRIKGLTGCRDLRAQHPTGPRPDPRSTRSLARQDAHRTGYSRPVPSRTRMGRGRCCPSPQRCPSRAGAKAPATDHRGSQSIDRPGGAAPGRDAAELLGLSPTSASTNSSKQAETCVPMCRSVHSRGREEHVIIDGCVREWCLSPSPPSPRRVRAAGRLRPSDRLSRFGSDWIAASCDRCDHGTAVVNDRAGSDDDDGERADLYDFTGPRRVRSQRSTAELGSGLVRAPARGVSLIPGPRLRHRISWLGSARWIVPDCCNLIVTLQNLEPPMPDWEMTDSFEANGIQWTLYDSGPRGRHVDHGERNGRADHGPGDSSGSTGGAHPISRR